MPTRQQQRTPEDEAATEAAFIGAKEETDDDALAGEQLLFRSKGANFRAVMVARHRTTMPNGEVNVYGSDEHPAGKTIEFAPSGEYRTSDPKEIKFLRGLPTFNLEFWQVGAEPGAVPSPEAIMQKVVAATLDCDDAVLSQLEAEERESWNRQIVLVSIRSARQQVQAALKRAEG